MKKALITGANRGIGLELTKRLAHKGLFVILGVRTEAHATRTKQTLVADGIDPDQIDHVLIDLNDADSIKKATGYVAEKHPDLDLLVNNAGIAGDMQKATLATTPAEYQATWNVNVLGTLQVIQQLVPVLKKHQSQIVNLSGPNFATPFYNPAAYRVSKIALNGLIQSIAIDFYNEKAPVEIYGIFPGGVTTDINNNRTGKFMKTVQEAGEQLMAIIFDGKDHNGDIVGADQKIISAVKFTM
ncbi:SDR family NAD(P)-dependent oxidoreductase [Secundilactobacillus silagei]|uniref:Carbonyl reductase n=1 Tax=Secundilactobacillus silagei JCM 19001 TaxID=1302250 RepID=A0A1Z5IK88_9LACO|nr:SDR family NAD(P)-dependent oxidoreductase [Secundilactobacillus silagei]TDG69907.1 hypothetical protein C5L25_002027 [Secundilactobacillus silagei JCM 19001]GAX02099.1 carbonyl reductase [Secundilactobacillus silagei JCM 19001]